VCLVRGNFLDRGARERGFLPRRLLTVTSDSRELPTMKRPILLLAAVAAMALAGTAAAALVPGVNDPGSTGCPVASYAGGVLHLEKNCATTTNATAGADITGLAGQTFASATFTLASATQCQSGSPRFNVVTADGAFSLGCDKVTPTTNTDGTLTYLFDTTTIPAGGSVSFPTGAISSVGVLIDVEGKADVSKIAVNGVTQVPVPTTGGGPATGGGPTSKSDCKRGGWKNFTNPSFKNQGQCVSSVARAGHGRKNGRGAPAVTNDKSQTVGQAVTPGDDAGEQDDAGGHGRDNKSGHGSIHGSGSVQGHGSIQGNGSIQSRSKKNG
jgi:hypothetical protein